MECNWCSLSWSGVSLSAALLLLLSWTKVLNGTKKQRPPGPPGWPVVGNMFDLGTMPHQNLYKLRFRHGPVLFLRLGSLNTMVVQSAKAAAELFKNNDLTFCDRMVPDAVTSWSYNQGSIAFGKYGTYWRILRKLCSMGLLINKRINETAALQSKCVDNMIHWIEEKAAASRSLGGPGKVEISHFLFLMAFNVVGNLMLSRDLLEPESEEGREFFDAMNKIMEWAGKPKCGRLPAIFETSEPYGHQKEYDTGHGTWDMGRAMGIVSEFVKDRIQQKQSGIEKMNRDFLDVMLEYEGGGKEGPDKISERNVTIIILLITYPTSINGCVFCVNSSKWGAARCRNTIIH